MALLFPGQPARAEHGAALRIALGIQDAHCCDPRLLTPALGVEAQAKTRVSKGGKQGAMLKEAFPLTCCACTCPNLRGRLLVCPLSAPFLPHPLPAPGRPVQKGHGLSGKAFSLLFRMKN